MIFGKYINRYYLRHAPALLLGILALLMVDYIQLLVPQFTSPFCVSFGFAMQLS